ncbi:MAG TPA: hypothetical protein VK179_20505 [Bacteroidales bacterium]|nr:hypothetical protein [Bacteroidales bacterium]
MAKILLLILFAAGFYNLPAQETYKTVTRKSEKTFKYNTHGQIIIQAERGIISIQKWDRSEVSVEFTMSAKNKEESVARKDLDRIVYNLISSRGNIFLNNKTVIPDNEPQEIKSTLTCGYVIHVPSWANITVNNKFGRVTVNEISGVLAGGLQYCDLAVTNYNGILNLSIQVGDFAATNSNVRGSLKTRYAGITMDNVSGKLSVECESGSFKMISGEKPFNLTINSHATEILVNNKNCKPNVLEFEGSHCPLTMAKECYTTNASLFTTNYNPKQDQEKWMLNYVPSPSLPKLKIYASFGSITLL